MFGELYIDLYFVVCNGFLLFFCILSVNVLVISDAILVLMNFDTYFLIANYFQCIVLVSKSLQENFTVY